MRKVLRAGDGRGGESAAGARGGAADHRVPQSLLGVDEENGTLYCQFYPVQGDHGGAHAVVPQDSAADAADPGGAWAWIAIAAIIIASFAAFLAMLRVWRKVFWGKGLPEDKVPDELIIRKKLMAPSAALILGSLCMFIFSGIVLDVVDSASEQLLDTTAYTETVLGDEPIAVPNIDEIQEGR